MSSFVSFTIIGIVLGSTYAIAASGLVLTYATSNVFNFAHGAVGMVMTFLYWELYVHQGWPVWFVLPFILLIVAPAFGLVMELLIMRRLTTANTTTQLGVTVGLMVALIGAGQLIWKPGGRRVDAFFNGSKVSFGVVNVTAQQFITLGLALAVALGLYVLLNRTRIGTAMRAVVDNRELLALHGARPNVLSGLAWALGSSLAALTGILLAPQLNFDHTTLTFLVVSAYAGAMVGRLKSLPLTFVGAIALGLLTEYGQWLYTELPTSWITDSEGVIYGLKNSLPTIFLLGVMLVLPQEKLRVGRVTGTKLPRIPSWRTTMLWSAALLGGSYLLTGAMGEANNARFGQTMCLPLIMLSLVLLVGYGGDVSLCQLSFVGVGALVVARGFDIPFTGLGFHSQISPLSIVTAFLLTAVVGAIVALPALRLRGLYIGLGTLAIAGAMDRSVFESGLVGFGAQGSTIQVTRPSWLSTERSFALAVVVAFVVTAWIILAIRRSKYGRILLATRDSQAACATLGFSTTMTRVAVFAMSAGLAGVAGVFFAGMSVTPGTLNFYFFQNLPLLLFAIVFGVTSVTGVLTGGFVYGCITSTFIVGQHPDLVGLAYIVVLVMLRLLVNNPNGLVGLLFDQSRRIMSRPDAVSAPPGSAAAREPYPATAGLGLEAPVGSA
ncbi:MAG: amino acid/amide transporter rane protein 2, family / amino acid/amide transporter [Frankiales bacterium]|nr:amino acid/amide transporter rane protein 2, family / amino acid/amide transporter [Frankiales bacterium]